MTEITINIDHAGRTFVIRITAHTSDDDEIVALADELQTQIFRGLKDEAPSFDGPVPSVAFAAWIDRRLTHVTSISSIIVGVIGRISVILRDDSSHTPAMIVGANHSLPH